MNASQIDTGLLPRRKRLRLVRQSESTECGLAALAMIANAWGHDLDLGAMRRRFGLSSRGISLRALMQTADQMGLSARPLKVGLKGLASVRLPAILHWDMNHFVVVEKVRKGRAFILDPAQDGRWHDEESLSRHFTGVALELRPGAGFAPESESRRLRLSQLSSGVIGLKRTGAQVLVLSLVLQAFALTSPYFLQLAVDQALPAFDLDLLSVLALGFGLFALINAAAFALRSFVFLAAGTAFSFAIGANVARRLMRLPITWFEKRTIGDVLTRFQSVLPIQKLLTESAAASVIDGLLALLILALMLAYSAVLALVPVTALLLYGAVRLATFPAERRAENERIVAAGREQGAMIETLRGIVTLRLSGREVMRHATWQNKLSESLGARFAHERIRAWQETASTLIGGIEIVLLVWLSVGFAIRGGFTVGMVIAFLAYRLQFATLTKALVDRGIELRMLGLHLERLSDIVLTDEDPGFYEPQIHGAELEGAIELRDVSYAYGPHDAPVLKGLNLKIAPGEHVAITGISGGGKSTLAKLILGLLEPTGGEIRIDDIPLAQYGRRAFREHVAAVMQDDMLFAGTIAENVAGFDQVDGPRLAAALAAAAIEAEIAALPMKHLTLVGDMGSSLSGGQRQRILLARALYRQPRLLVMDESTAHLDADHERSVGRAISALGITRIVIAHRRETIAAADRVVVLADGQVSAEESGRFQPAAGAFDPPPG